RTGREDQPRGREVEGGEGAARGNPGLRRSPPTSPFPPGPPAQPPAASGGCVVRCAKRSPSCRDGSTKPAGRAAGSLASALPASTACFFTFTLHPLLQASSTCSTAMAPPE